MSFAKQVFGKTALETSGEDVKTTLETSGEDVRTTLATSGKQLPQVAQSQSSTKVILEPAVKSNEKTTLQTSGVLSALSLVPGYQQVQQQQQPLTQIVKKYTRNEWRRC